MGGIEQVIHQLAKGCSKLGHEVAVLSLTAATDPQPIKIDGYTVFRGHLDYQVSSAGFSISAFNLFRKLAKDVDIIHYHYPWPFMDLVFFLSGVKKPSVVSYHSDIVRQKYLLQLYKPLKRKFLRAVNAIVAASPNYLNSSEVLTKYKDKVKVIPYGLDKTSYPKAAPDKIEHWQRKLGNKFYLFVGVIRYYKGLHILIDAARDTNYPIAIVGAGPVEQELREQVERLGLNNIHFLGLLPDEDKVALLTACYGVVFPSHLRSEAFGISLLEGAMYGKPLISCEIGTGTSFINIANETGLVVEPNDAFAFGEAMKFLWNNPGRAAEMGAAAEKRYRELFTAEKMLDSYLKLYNEASNAH